MTADIGRGMTNNTMAFIGTQADSTPIVDATDPATTRIYHLLVQAMALSRSYSQSPYR